ncbi:unnamed protein product [Symbiodinium necroappetens]|uniref:Uncharacterized protein n=1 Tax=Symbiodinium necroappetens TaxID=1628268 RepID=A0A812Q752_9DINO|nr:unnamed protein product [Symbiodinium necroappetens]
MHAEMQINFAASRGSSEVLLLQSKVERILAVAIEAVENARSKALRRRVGQRLRKKLSKVLHQKEFEQAVAIFMQKESELSREEASLKEDQQEGCDSSVQTPRSSADVGSFSRQTTLQPMIANSATCSNSLPCQAAMAIPVPVIAVPFLVPVLAAPARAVAQQSGHPHEVAVPSLADAQALEEAELEKTAFLRSITRTTGTTEDGASTLSAMDDDDIADRRLEWIRAVTEQSPAPVERTFIQFNTKLTVSHRRSSSR